MLNPDQLDSSPVTACRRPSNGRPAARAPGLRGSPELRQRLLATGLRRAMALVRA